MDTRGGNGNGIFGRGLALGENRIDVEMHDRILAQIAAGREKQTHIIEVMSGLPSWATKPFEGDQDAFNAALKSFQAADPTVTALEQRLTNEPGPIWRNFTPEEETALANWTKAVDDMGAVVEKYFPSNIAKDLRNIVLLLVGVGAIFGPLLWTTDESEPRKFGIRPPLPPTGARPAPAPGPLPLPPGVLPFRPPAPPAPGVMRPAVMTFAPGVPIPPPGSAAIPTPRFARPLTSPAGGPGSFVYPRYAP